MYLSLWPTFSGDGYARKTSSLVISKHERQIQHVFRTTSARDLETLEVDSPQLWSLDLECTRLPRVLNSLSRSLETPDTDRTGLILGLTLFSIFSSTSLLSYDNLELYLPSVSPAAGQFTCDEGFCHLPPLICYFFLHRDK